MTRQKEELIRGGSFGWDGDAQLELHSSSSKIGIVNHVQYIE
jgi:hypothetical protein